MRESKQSYVWFSSGVLFLGLVIFIISLLVAMSATRWELHEQNRVLYFDRKILPDHLFYPLVVAIDRLELEFSSEQERIVLQMDYATKRREAAGELFLQGKNELAFSTLTKGHQYLLQANEAVAELGDKSKFLTFLVGLDQEFMTEYQEMKLYMDDSQQASVERMLVELRDAERRL